MRLEIKNEDRDVLLDSYCKDYYLENIRKVELRELKDMIEICNDCADYLADVFLSRLPVDLDEEN